MNFYVRRFNLYLLLALVALPAGGCAWTKKKIETVGAIRIHVEAPVPVAGRTETIRVLRSQPVDVLIDEDPTVTERNIIAATLLETPGGFAVRVKFDETGSWMIEQTSAGNPGKHLAIFAQWGETISEGRWIAAPIITHRIADGVITFTPDATREEAAKLVEGLNHTAKLLNSKADQ
ncbi:MAG TPA: hypothetical protein VK815_05005 [Candidatus Acidoferrales bacterium]|jgi:hypothetical protein|nr:hypothetical protein [Candidatus Acidoferrales bacterium]